MIISRYLKKAFTVFLTFILASNAFAMQSPEQSILTIEPYHHERDYHDLYSLFNANQHTLGFWGYDDTFPLGNQIQVARIYDQLAGFVIYTKNANEGFVSYLAVNQEVQSNGLGKTLLNNAINDLKQQGASSVSLNVYEHNKKAQSLYERLGFFQLTNHGELLGYRLNLA